MASYWCMILLFELFIVIRISNARCNVFGMSVMLEWNAYLIGKEPWGQEGNIELNPSQ